MRNLLNKLKGKKLNKKLISIMLSVLIAFTFTAGYFISVVNASTIEVSNLKIGDTITLGRVGDLDLVWRVVGFDNDGQIYQTGTNPYVVLDNWTDLTYYKGLQFDFPHTGDSYSYYNTFGSNDWQESALRKLLNSTEDAAHVDYTDTYYSGSGYNLNGFLHDFTSEEVDLIKDTTHIYAVNGNIRGKNGTNDMPYDEYSNEDYRTMSKCQFIGYNNLLNTYYHKESTEKVFLMSYYEYGQAQQKGSSGGFVWSDRTTDGKHYFLLRDASTHFSMDYTHCVRWVHYNKITAHNSDINGNNVANHYIEELDSNVSDENTYIRPACVLDGTKTLSVRSEGDYYVPKPSLEDATIEGIQDEIFYDGTDKKQSGYTVKYNGNSLVEATWNSNLYANELNIGDVVNLGRLGDTELQWLVVGYGPDCESDRYKGAPFLVLNNWASTDLNSYHGMAFDLPHSGSSDSNEKSSGSNEWGNSTLRTWLNSDKAASEIDYSHPNYTGGDPYSKNGFLHDFTTMEKSALAVTNHKYIVSSGHGYDEGDHTMATNNGAPSVALGSLYDTAYSKYSEDYVFPLSIKELVNAANNAYTLGFNWKPSTYTYFLRDANAANLSAVRKVDTTQVGTTAANPSSGLSNFALRPAILLKEDTRIKKLGNSSYGFEYELGQISSGDYFVTYQGDTIGPGEVTMKINGRGSYEGTKTITYNIVKKDINDADFEGFEEVLDYDGGKEVLQSGYKISYDGETLIEVVSDADTDVNDLNLYDVVKLGRLGGVELEWQVIGFGPDCEPDKSKGGPYLALMTWNKSGLSNYHGMVFDAVHNADDPNANRKTLGSNNWGTSTIRTWLNSDKKADFIDYSHQYYQGNPYPGKNGFLSEFTEREKDLIADTTHKYLINGDVDTPEVSGLSNQNFSGAVILSSAITGYDTSNYQTSTDKVFLMSIKEIYNATTYEGIKHWGYNSTDYNYFLRDATATTVNAVRYIKGGENPCLIDSKFAIIDNSNQATINNFSIRPALVLKPNVKLKNLGKDTNITTYEATDFGLGTDLPGDYEVSYSGDTTKTGEITMTIKGRGKYTGTKTFTYSIYQKQIADAEISGLQENVLYDGTPKKQSGYVLKDKDGNTLTEVLGDGDTDATTLKLGDIVTLGKLGGHPLKWRVVGFDEECSETGTNPFLVLENWLDDELSGYAGMRFDAKHESTDPDSHNRDYGAINWANSTLRMWFNSTNKAGNWYAHEHYTSGLDPYGKDGFLHEFEEFEVEAIKPVTHKFVVDTSEKVDGQGTAVHTHKSGNLTSTTDHPLQNYDTAFYQLCEDKVFALNIRELYNAYLRRGTSGFLYSNESFGYYLRDENIESSAIQVRNVAKGATAYVSSSYTNEITWLRLRPGLVLKQETALKTLESGKYQVAQPGVGEYTVSYSRTNGDSNDLTSPGEIKITFTGAGSYGGTKTFTYNIVKKSMNDVEVTGIEDKLYDGTPKLQSGYTLKYTDGGGSNYTLVESISNADSTISNLKLGDIVSLGKLGDTKLLWRVAGFGVNCESDSSKGAPYLVLDNWKDSSLSSYRGMIFDPEHDTTDTSDRNNWGSNNWETSTIRKWLNSDVKASDIDYTHTHYTSGTDPYNKDGFLYGFTQSEKDAIASVTHKNLVRSSESNTPDRHDGGSTNLAYNYSISTYDNGYDDAYYQNTTDKIFFMNMKELRNAINNKDASGFVYCGSNSEQYRYFLRDAEAQGECNIRESYYNGNITKVAAYSGSSDEWLRPAIILNSDAELKSCNKTSDGYDFEIANRTDGDFKVSYEGDTTNGKKVTIKFIGLKAFDGTIEREYNINKKSMNDVEVAPLTDFVYNGESQLQSSFSLKYKDETPLVQKTSDADSTISNLKLGDIVSLGKLGDTKLIWRVVGFGENCEKDSSKGAPYLVLENWKDNSLSSYRGMTFDPRHDGTDNVNRNTYGSNNWEASTIRKWLNSDVKASDINYIHDHYSSGTDPYGKNGFLFGFEDYEKEAIATVTHKNLVYSTESNTPDRHDGGTKINPYNYTEATFANGYDDAYYQNTTEKIFFMNMKELRNAIDHSSDSGFSYYDSKYYYFLRDASDSNHEIRVAYYTSYIAQTSGSQPDMCLRPAIILSEDAGLKACDIASDSCNFKIAETIDGDFTVSYSSDTINVGEVTVTFTGCGSYEGTKTAKYNILSNEIDTDDITIEISDEITYTGSAIELSADDITVKVKSGGEFVTIDSSNYTITGYSEDHTNAGEASVTIKLSGIFDSDPITKKFTINKASLSENDLLTMPDLQQDLVFTGSMLTPTGQTVYLNGEVLESSNYTLSLSDNVNAGSGKVTVTGKGNFGGSKDFTFPIAAKTITSNEKITISEIEDKERTGAQITPSFTIFDEDILSGSNPKALVSPSDYTYEYGENKEIGEGSITITGCGNYTGSKTFKFNIVGAKVDDEDVLVEIEDDLLVFDNTAKEPSYTVKINGVTITTSDYDFVEYKNNVNATTSSSKAKLVIRLKNNYSSSSDIEREFEIKPLSITGNDSITMPNVNADNFIYTGSNLTPSDLAVKWNTNTLVKDTDYTLALTDNLNAGFGKVTVTGKGNFAGSKEFSFEIAKRNLETDNVNGKVSYFVPDEEYKNGDQIKPTEFTLSDSLASNALTLNTDYEITGYGTNTQKGEDSGSITIKGINNFEGNLTLTFDIVGQKINDLSKIHATLDDSNLIYTGDALTPSDKITVSLDGVGVLTSDDWEVVNGSWLNNTNAGNASVKVKLKGNYSSDPVTINFTIKQKELNSADFAFVGDGVATKNVTKKNEYTNSVPTSEYSKLVVKYQDVVLNFTSAIYEGLQTDPMKFGAFAVTLSGLSVSDTNYKLKDTFTSFSIDDTHGLIVDKIKPELLSAFVTITNGTYKTGDMIYIELNFDKDISKSGDDPKLEFYSNVLLDGKIGTLEVNKYKAVALYDSISQNKVKFKYKVIEGDYLPNGFTFALSGIINFESLKDSRGNIVNYESKSQRFDNVIIVSKTGVFDEIKNLVEGNDSNKEQKILNIIKDDNKTDLIFDGDAELKSKIGSGAIDDTLREEVSEYLTNGEDLDLSDISKLIDEIKKALLAKDLEDEIRAKLDDAFNLPTKEEIDDMMIKYQKLSSNQKKIFDEDLKQRLDNLYYGMLTDGWKYKDSPSGEANEIEMYGIATRTSAALDKAVKLKVERIYDNARINELQGMVEANPGSTGERIIAPYDITLVDSDDVPVTIPGENVFCKIELPVGYYGKVINIYHKVDDSHIETVQNKLIQKIGDKCLVYFDCDSFSPYFMTSDAISVKATLDPESTEGTVSPLGLFTVNQGENKDFIFTKSGETNRVDITLSKFNNQTKTFDLVTGIDPINLFNTSKYTLKNITTNMFITFKLSHDDNFKKSGGSSGGGGGGGGGGSTPKPQEPVVPVPPVEPEKEFEIFNAYMKGYEDGTFRPQLNMTRAEAATIIARISEDFSEDANFTEISKSYQDYNSRHWANNYIGYVTEVGIMCGDEVGFRPDDKITRGEFSKLIYKLLNLENANLAIVKTFDDCKGKFYETYANALYSAGILTGYEDGTFNGSGKLTRTEAAIMINKATGRGLDKEETLKAIKESENFKEFKDVSSNRWFYFDDMMATVSYTLEKETDQTLVDNPEKD